jgi:uncharacterized SAM-binding protein YcdF (DUF218 family)
LRRWRFALGLSVVVAVIFFLLSSVWLHWLGEYMVRADSPAPADAVLVLAGGWGGERIVVGAELVKSGYARRALISGPTQFYGVNEADLAVSYLVDHGYPQTWFEPVHLKASSTREEALQYRNEFQRRKIRKVLIVTSNFHTRRAGDLFRDILGKNCEVRMIAAPDPFFTPETWWHTREGRKTFFYEAVKTVTSWVGM